MKRYMNIAPEVRNALDNNQAVVALESTIISHGMPYPQNVETAREVEQIVRDNGAVPATIAILDGEIKVGLTNDELEKLGNSKNAVKVSRRDIPEVIAKNQIGATTVASTMIFARMAGIKFFVTGGIGGVHRGANETMDISADLEELSNTKVVVICSGAKSILDLPKTLEYLETKGVLVTGFQTDELPAFFTRKSGLKLTSTVNNLEEMAKITKVKFDLGLEGGIVLANPVPAEYEMEQSFIDSVIENAVIEADMQGIGGKESTPFLLSKVVEATEGESLKTNIALVKNNAKIGAQLANQFWELNNRSI